MKKTGYFLIIVLVTAVLAVNAFAAPVLLDNYDGVGDLIYNEDTDPQWSITSGHYLAVTDGSALPNHSYASYDLSSSISGWEVDPANENEWIGWMNILRAPSGWGGTNYGCGYVLASDNPVFSDPTATGYALIIRNNPDELVLISFSQGITSGSVDLPVGSTEILNTGYIYDIGDGGVNVYVKLESDGNWTVQWVTGAALSDADAVDPVNYTSVATTVTPATPYSGPGYEYAGWVWSHSSSTSSTSSTQFDNFGAGPDGVLEEYDWGDAPDSPYPTLAINNGAHHDLLMNPMLILGTMVDPEPDGQPDYEALGDDNNALDDEDGVSNWVGILPGNSGSVDVVAMSGGMLDLFIDWDHSGVWGDQPGEVYAYPLNPGLNTLPVLVPVYAQLGATYARFRLSSMGGLPPTGFAPDGEVEDHMLFVDTDEAWVDWGDAPDPSYPTLQINNGANHHINPMVYMGLSAATSIDPEVDGQPHVSALGDDNDGNDDEDGVTFSILNPGQSGTMNVDVSVDGVIDAWIDFNQDGDWADSGEQIASATPVFFASNPNVITFSVPAGAVNGVTFARVRFNTWGFALPTTGSAPDGEVEDYEVIIEELIEDLDFGDAPDLIVGPGFFYPTTLVIHGDPARHIINTSLYLGPDPMDIDNETDGQPEPAAMGDDMLDGNDDEDGINFLPPLIAGNTGNVDIFVGPTSNPGYISGWIDFNQDGDWNDAGEQIFSDNGLLMPGSNILPFPIPAGAATGFTFARFRFYSTPGIPCNTDHGLCLDGEVEDHLVEIEPWIPPDVIINEVDADTPSTDNMEFIEIYDGGVGNTPLDGLVVVLFNGSDDQSYDSAFDLDGYSTDSNGYFLMGNSGVSPAPALVFPSDTLQNGADAVAIYVGNGSDFPNDTPVTTTNLIDALVYDTFDDDDSGLLILLNSGEPQVNEGELGEKDYHSNQRCPNGSGGARYTNTYTQRIPSPGSANTCPALPLDPTGCSATAMSICNGDSTDISAVFSSDSLHWFTSGCYTGGYVGSPDYTGSPVTVSPTADMTYFAQAYDSVNMLYSANCCSVTITVNDPPDCTISAPASYPANTTGNTAEVPNAGSGANYTWTVGGNGTLTGGQNTRIVEFSVGSAGTNVTLDCTIVDGNTCTCTATQVSVPVEEPAAIPATTFLGLVLLLGIVSMVIRRRR